MVGLGRIGRSVRRVMARVVRGVLPRTITSLLLVTALSLGTAGCSGSGTPKAKAAPETNAVPVTQAFDLKAFCASVRVRCQQVRSRWAVVYPTRRDKRRGILLWDAGGPGFRPLDEGAVRAALPGWTQGFDVVSFPERWTSVKVGRPCLLDLRPSIPNDRNPRCPWSRFSETVDDYEELLNEFESINGQLSGVYAASFGAVRALPAIQSVTDRGGFAIVESPAPWPSMAGAQILRARIAAARRAIVSTPSCRRAECRRRTRLVEQILGGRVRAIDPGDFELAMLGMAYDLEGNERFLDHFWSRSGRIGRAELVSLRRVGLGFSLVTGRGIPREERAGYLAATCSMYRGWSPEPRSALEKMHRSCDAVESNGYRKWAYSAQLSRGRSRSVLLLLNRSDPVVPFRLQRFWSESAGVEPMYLLSERGHVSMPDRLDGRVSRWVDQRLRAGAM